MIDLTEEMMEGWARVAAEGRTLDIQDEMSLVTMKIITRAMFSDHLSGEEARAVTDAIRVLSRHEHLQLRDLIGVPSGCRAVPTRRYAGPSGSSTGR